MAVPGNRYQPGNMEFSDDDDENVPLNKEMLSGSQRTVQETKQWDVFRDLPNKPDSGSMESHNILDGAVKIVKVFAYLITFLVVLAAGVTSKGSLLFMTSQLKKDLIVPYCNKDVAQDKQFQAEITEVERISWMWCLFFAFSVPELGTLIRSLRIVYFKTFERPSGFAFFFVFVMEGLHTIGLAILIYMILPELDVIKGIMLTNCMCFLPGVINMLSRNSKHFVKNTKYMFLMAVDVLALSAQVTGFVVWPLLEGKIALFLIPVSIVLISCGWWENFVTMDSPLRFIRFFAEIKKENIKSRYYTYAFVSVWKLAVFFLSILVILWAQGEDVWNFFTKLPEAFGDHEIPLQEILPEFGGVKLDQTVRSVPADYFTPLYVTLVQILGSYVCYIFGKFACKILIQGFSFAFPINLTVPVTISLLIAFCGLRNSDPCYFYDIMPSYLFFVSPPIYFIEEFITHEVAWIWIFWLLSQTWITLHIWTPKCERLASTEKLFVTPMYNSFLIDQSLAMNRHREDLAKDSEELDDFPIMDESEPTPMMAHVNSPHSQPRSPYSTTRIYICATMWHENKDEMMEFLKSIFRLDEDQCARRIAEKYLGIEDPDYYELETHIFFDDAFEISDYNDDDSQVNRFVRLLVNSLDDAATEVHQTHVRIRAPKKYPTPYGGRLVWTLPGKTKMITHLKDKSKIRHRKRWSQVMYMYYLLGHRLMERPITVNQKTALAENTYLLALDGDIDFQPKAVLLLIDLMKKNKNLGAACGRIHPIGSGPMVWYQKFEYAIGHWLQKATEHMIGCVLCSPGCFSLFRAKGLMDDNVMRKYTTKSDEARHYVQYDQGEDRWLCTLLLQRGYRVEYSAASDAFTHAPEGFNEFYNQRRRWVPSTMANIFDLLVDYKRTIKVNENISLPYIVYQAMLMGSTILGPGTIFLMLVGAFVAAFKIDNWTSFYYNIVPILIFMVVCFLCKANIQLFFAGLISAVYGLVMIAVIVGLMLQITEDGPFAPSSLFFFVVAGEMIVTAFLHPAELGCLPCGVIYYVTVPSMYMLLIIYSIFNMNNVTWGTREVVAKQGKKTAEQIEQEKREAEEAAKQMKNKKGKAWYSFLQGNTKDEEGSFELSFAGLFKCMFCTHGKTSDEKVQLLRIAESLDALSKKMDSLERSVDPTGAGAANRRRTTAGASRDHTNLGTLSENFPDADSDDTQSEISVPRDERDMNHIPYWIEDPELRKGEVDFLSTTEVQFWNGLLDQYLSPIDADKKEEARIAGDLKDLRDKSVFAFFMLNALFVLIVFLLQLNKDFLHIKWPLGIKTNVTYDDSTQEILINREYLELEPIGFVFLIFFAIIMVIQFTAMLFHRFGTLMHILSSTELNWYCNKKVEDFTPEEEIKSNAVEIVKFLQRLKPNETEAKDKNGNAIVSAPARRHTVHNLEKARKDKRQIDMLDVAFKKRYLNEEESPELPRKLTIRRDTLNALNSTRKSIIVARRQSQMQMQMQPPGNMRNSNLPPVPSGAHINHGYDAVTDDDDDAPPSRPSVRFPTNA